MIKMAIASFGKEIVAPWRSSEMRGPMSENRGYGMSGNMSRKLRKAKRKMKGKGMMQSGKEMVEHV